MINQRLEVIHGLVSDLQIRQSEEDFIFSNTDKSIGGVAAAGLAATGLAGAATNALLNSNDTADKVSIFICKVGNELVSGRFGEVTFFNGDEVEVVGERQANYMKAAAVRRPADRTIWMHPHCGRGRIAYILFSIKWIGLVSFGIPILMALADLIFSETPKGLIFFIVMPLIVGSMIAFVFSFNVFKFKKFSELSTTIFSTLGFDDPNMVDLPKVQKNILKNATNEERLAFHPHARWVYKY